MRWKKSRLGEICEVFGGTTPSTSKSEYWNGNIVWLSPSDLPEIGRIVSVKDSSRKISELAVKNSSLTILPKGAVVYSTRASIGKIGIAECPLTTNQGFANFVCNESIYNKFLAYSLKYYTKDISKLSNSTTFAEVSRSNIKNFEIPVPPFQVQVKIANILDNAVELRDRDLYLLKRYDDLLASIFHQMFGDIITNSKGWPTNKLGDLCLIRRGASPRPISAFQGGSVPWIKIGDGTKGNNVYIESTAVYITKEGANKSVYLEPGSLIFANCGVSLGFARILKIGGCIHDGWLSLEKVDEKKINKIFLLKLINSITDHLRRIAPDGTQPNLNTGIMKDLVIPIPELKLQEKFEKIVFQIEAIKAIAKRQSDRSESLFQSLLQKTFKGELVK
jgi:type I restriction enzyme, S subunit